AYAVSVLSGYSSTIPSESVSDGFSAGYTVMRATVSAALVEKRRGTSLGAARQPGGSWRRATAETSFCVWLVKRTSTVLGSIPLNTSAFWPILAVITGATTRGSYTSPRTGSVYL